MRTGKTSSPVRIESLESRRLLSAISIADATTTEGSDLNFIVSLDAAVPFNTTVKFSVGAKTAKPGKNFNKPFAASITIPKGLTTGTIVVQTLDDLIDSPDKTLVARIAPLRGFKMTDKMAIGTLQDID